MSDFDSGWAVMEATLQFPFVERLPAREKSKLAKLWRHFDEVKELMKEKGTLVPMTIAADLIEVSRQRVDELVERGHLERVEFHGRPFITEVSLVRWARAERPKGGRGHKSLPLCDSDRWECSKSLVSDFKG